MKIIITAFISLFLVNYSYSQSIEKSWYCEESNHLCVNLKEKGKAEVDELKKLKYKVKNNTLEIISVKDVYVFTIEKLTEDTLILSQDFSVNQFEHIPDSIATFLWTPEGCYGRWKED